jgi:hypothetical protein
VFEFDFERHANWVIAVFWMAVGAGVTLIAVAVF